MSYIKQEDSGGGGDITGSGANTQVAVFNGAKSITSAGVFTANLTNGRVTAAGYNMNTGSAASPALAINGDTDTGVFSAGANQIGFTVAGSDALGVGANKNVTVGGASGTAGQVLTSGGSGGATTWTTVSGGASLNQALNPRDLVYSIAPTIIDTYLLSRGVGMTCVGTLSNSFLTRSAYSSPRFRSFIAPKTGDVSAFLVSVATADASTNFLVGIYSQTNGLPTALMGRAEMDCSSTGEVEQTTIEDASGSSATISLTQGEMYFYAWNRTNSTGNPRLHAENPAGAQFTANQVQTVNAVDESYNILDVSAGSSNTLPATPTANQIYIGGGSSYPLRLGIKYS